MIKPTIKARLRWGRPLATVEDLHRTARGEGAEVVSFDLFDTLVFRTFNTPSDVFRQQGRALVAAGLFAGTAADWLKARKDVEEALSVEAMPAEVTLEGIYDRLLHDGHFADRDARDAAMAEELRVEAACITAHPGSAALIAGLRAKGLRVAVSSDTYLPVAFIADVLKRLDLTPDELFVSSDTMTTKRHGTMFAQLKEKYPKLIHVGDNPRVDFRAARRQGVKGFWFVWPYYADLEGFGAERRYLRQIGQEHLPATIALRTGSALEDLGIRWAVVLYDYLRTARAHARANGVTDIWLLSRDGESLNAALEAVPAFLDGVPVRYVRASRKFTHSVTALRAPERFSRWNKRDASAGEQALGQLVERYYRAKLRDETRHVMVVDMTGKGRLEASIRSALPDDVRVSGFYFSLDFGHEAGPGYGQFIPRKFTAFHQAAVESLSGFTEGTCIGAVEQDGEIQPMLEQNAQDVAPLAYVRSLRATLASLCAADDYATGDLDDALIACREEFVRNLQMYPTRAIRDAMSEWPFVDSFGAPPTVMTKPPVAFLDRVLARKGPLNVWPSLGIYSAVPARVAPAFMAISQLRLALKDKRGQTR